MTVQKAGYGSLSRLITARLLHQMSTSFSPVLSVLRSHLQCLFAKITSLRVHKSTHNKHYAFLKETKKQMYGAIRDPLEPIINCLCLRMRSKHKQAEAWSVDFTIKPNVTIISPKGTELSSRIGESEKKQQKVIYCLVILSPVCLFYKCCGGVKMNTVVK